jgi:hypothetical protein
MAVTMKMAVIALMMEAVQTSETLVNSRQSTRRCNPEDSHLQETIFIHLRQMYLTFWKSCHFLLEIMTLVSSAYIMGSDNVLTVAGRSFMCSMKGKSCRIDCLGT